MEDVNEPTVESVTQDIGDLEAKVVTAKEQLTALQAAAALAQKAADEKAGDQAQLDALDKQEIEVARQKAALKLKLAKK